MATIRLNETELFEVINHGLKHHPKIKLAFPGKALQFRIGVRVRLNENDQIDALYSLIVTDDESALPNGNYVIKK